MVYRVSSRTCRDTKRNPVWKTSKKRGKIERTKETTTQTGLYYFFFRFCVSVFFSIFKIFIRFYFWGLRVLVLPGSGGTCLNSQHLGGRGTWIFYFEATLVYRVSSRTVRDTQKIPVSKN